MFFNSDLLFKFSSPRIRNRILVFIDTINWIKLRIQSFNCVFDVSNR